MLASAVEFERDRAAVGHAQCGLETLSQPLMDVGARLHAIDHDIDVDRAIQDRHGPERRNYEERMGITAFARLWVDTFVKGDQSTNARVFNGLQVRARKFCRLYHNSTASGGAALSLANLDQFLNNISKKSGTTYIMVPFISLPLWIQAARTQTLTGFVMQTWDETGMPKLSYADGYGEGEKLLAIQAGVYTDDIDAVVFERAVWIAAGGLAGLLLAVLAAFALGRGLVRPLGAICGVMDALAKGDLNVEVPFVEQAGAVRTNPRDTHGAFQHGRDLDAR